ncbi:fumarylacetoacetate hydrolase family protein [Burkholderia sp. BCC1977]|uniref:fumarylacetoacetate hydrolase family protein n=1 Tax=Burkholderia sp. BCC1977 TaxID=2817440 RepID=UPI002ABDC198|nr:fumarylacetoacetate hydrolase family protein [Burkholderia sp. BCC1977]
MKLATLNDGTRDGRLVVVSRDLRRAVTVEDIAPTMQAALDDWERISPLLELRYAALQTGHEPAMHLDIDQLAAPLPRTYSWIDASAYLSHMERAQKLRGATPPPSYTEEPLLYDGPSGTFLSATAPIPLPPGDVGMDIEGEIGVVLGDMPLGTATEDVASYIRLFTLVNDVSLRTVIQQAIAKGQNPLYHGKPPCSMAPVAVTPDELGSAWDGRRLSLPLLCSINGQELGRANAGVDMHFDFPTLLARAVRTRSLSAGTVLGSGTVSNRDASLGVSCIAERRMLEVLEGGQPTTPYLRSGDRVRIEMCGSDGKSIFGAIDQTVVAVDNPVN